MAEPRGAPGRVFDALVQCATVDLFRTYGVAVAPMPTLLDGLETVVDRVPQHVGELQPESLPVVARGTDDASLATRPTDSDRSVPTLARGVG